MTLNNEIPWDNKALEWGPSKVATLSAGGKSDNFRVDSVRMSSSTVDNTGFENDLNALSWNPDSVSKIEKNYGTGEYSTASGLVASDASSTFTPQSGRLADEAAKVRNTQVSAAGDSTSAGSTPSTRPYIWKYQ